jgi:hypothetical protein
VTIVWIIVSAIISLIGLFVFVMAGYVYLFGTTYDAKGRRLDAIYSMIGFAGIFAAWLWPVILPIMLLVGFALIVRGVFKGGDESPLLK